MKSIYWHKKFISRYVIAGFCIFMLAWLYLVQAFIKVEKPDNELKIQAAELTLKSYDIIQQKYLSLGYKCDSVNDPMCTGLIGERVTSITTDPGNLNAKRSSINPNMAAYFVKMMKEADLQPGDVIALQETGSYPALDIAMLAAIKTMQLKPLIIFSVGASNFGANRYNLTWPDMYHTLQEAGIFDYEPIGITLGGSLDIGYGLTPDAVNKMVDAIKRNGYHFIEIPDNDNATNVSVETRIQLYNQAAGDQPIKAYINVGGNMASIGLKTNVDKSELKIKPKSLAEGLITKLPPELTPVNSVAVHMLKNDIPVINIRNITHNIINQYHLPYAPNTMPVIGTGMIYEQPTYNTTLAVIVLLVDILVLLGVAIASRKYLITYKSK